MTQQQPPIITIKMVPAGVELVLNALNQLPRAQVDGLFDEIVAQYSQQAQELQMAAQAANASAATYLSTDAQQGPDDVAAPIQ